MTTDHPGQAPPRMCLDPVTGRPAFVAPQRAGRPDDRALVARRGAANTPFDWCPFCAGNEAQTPDAVLRTPADAGLPWRSRIVPNAFPITVPASRPRAAGEARTAVGIHDVVIESPRHDRSILEIAADAWEDVWSLCHRRLAAAAVMDGLAWATVFKNSGARAGASLEHVHSQIVGIDVVPPAIATEAAAVARDPATFLRLIEAARAEGRIVMERDGLVALVPPAPRQPFETWLVTTFREPHLHEASPARVAALAALTRELVGRLDRVAAGCHYNWWLHQAPFARTRTDDAVLAAWHWHLEVLPRLSELAGFEIGTGCHITTLPAEEAARRLRDAAD